MTDGRGIQLENHDGRADLCQAIHTLQIVIVQSNATVRDIFSQESRIESAMNEEAFAEPQCIFPQYARLDAVRVTLRWQSFFNEGPIRLHPHRIDELRLNGEFPRGVSNTHWPLASGLVQAAAG